MSNISQSVSEGSTSRRNSRVPAVAFPTQDYALLSEAGHLPRPKTPTFYHRPSSSSMSIRSNASDTDRSDILAPIPRRHLSVQRSASQHWLGSPPLSPVSVASRGVSPVSFSSLSPSHSRRKHGRSLSAVLENEKGKWKQVLHNVPQGETHSSEKHDMHNSPVRKWARWMHKQGLKDWVVMVVILLTALVKWCVGLGGYSGRGTPPMFGDYEAQRHWMELTIHLPIRQWYTYDTKFWGLDYPPLTAYVSWICGIIGSRINSAWFALCTSRGFESLDHQIYMRATVLALDTLIYVPAVVYFTRIWQANRSSRTQHVALLTLLLQPALALIDNGHFQYNSVMLGFTLLAVDCFGAGRDLLGAFFFVQSLGFKQMALYYAPAIGSYLLAKCIYLGPRDGFQLLVRLAAVTVLSFILLFLPWLPPFAPLGAIFEPITRIFPFFRGLFEDKVANFWCASNVLFKWRVWFSREALVKISALLTAIGFAPSVLGLLYSGYKLSNYFQNTEGKIKARAASSPILPLLPYALLGSSMSFFLFSFQVHEKTILVPLLPLTLLLSSAANDSFTFQLGVLVNNVAVFSMWPLLKRDGIAVQYFAIMLLWNRLIGYSPFHASSLLLRYASVAIYSACILLHIAEAFIPPPVHLPDIYSVLNVLISTPVFAFTWLWSIKRGVEVGWALGGLGSSSASPSTLATSNSSSKSKASEAEDPAPMSTSSGVADGNGFLDASSSAVSDKRKARDLKTRSVGYFQGRRSSLRTGTLSDEWRS